MTGIVKAFYPRGGFGFIAPLIGRPETTPDIYFHVTSVRGMIVPPVGAEVTFLVVRGIKGPQAANIELKTVRLPRDGDPPDCSPAAG